jgi:hypothetical protein
MLNPQKGTNIYYTLRGAKHLKSVHNHTKWNITNVLENHF